MLFEEMLTVKRWFNRKSDLGSAAKAGPYRVYVKDPSEVPEGRIVHRGEQGGLYYETDQAPAAAEKKPEPRQAKLEDTPEPPPQTQKPDSGAQLGTMSKEEHIITVLGPKFLKARKDKDDLWNQLRKNLLSSHEMYAKRNELEKEENEYRQAIKELKANSNGTTVLGVILNSMDMDKDRALSIDPRGYQIIFEHTSDKDVKLILELVKGLLYPSTQGVKIQGARGLKGIYIHDADVQSLKDINAIVYAGHTEPIDGDVYKTTPKNRKAMEKIMKTYGGSIQELEAAMDKLSPLIRVAFQNPVKPNLNAMLNVGQLKEGTYGTHMQGGTAITITTRGHDKLLEELPAAKGTLEDYKSKIMIGAQVELKDYESKSSMEKKTALVRMTEVHGLGRNPTHWVMHEMGHLIYDFYPSLKTQWEMVDAKERAQTTAYAAKCFNSFNAHLPGTETFAEATGLYIMAPEYLKKYYPAVHDFMERLFKDSNDMLERWKDPSEVQRMRVTGAM